MSILIRGMEMPTSCAECLLADCSKSPCYKVGGVVDWERRPDWCPLIEIPPHGRLGDLDAMAFNESEAYMSAQAKLGRDVITTGINSIVHRKIQLLIMDTPTIIESEVSK